MQSLDPVSGMPPVSYEAGETDPVPFSTGDKHLQLPPVAF